MAFRSFEIPIIWFGTPQKKERKKSFRNKSKNKQKQDGKNTFLLNLLHIANVARSMDR